MKLDRLIGILTVLLRHEQVTAPMLAERFEVSCRTINRDIEDLCLAGIPIMTKQGKTGGVFIAPGYKINQFVLNRAELQAILIGVKSLDSIAGAPRYRAIMNKFAGEGQDVIAVDEIMQIELSSHNKDMLTLKIEQLRQAVESQNIITFAYYAKNGESQRMVEPYKIVFRWAAWYLFGFCTHKQAFRLFKLGRMWDITTTTQSFTVRKVPKHEPDVETVFDGGIELIAMFDESVKYKLFDEYGIDFFVPQADGKLKFTMTFTHQDYLVSWLLGYGDAVEVVEPAHIKRALLTQAKKIVERYNKT